MKITLNTSIPENQRPQVEALIRSHARISEVVWLPSRFPRIVMLIEPGPNAKSEPEAGSIFDSPNSGSASLASLTEFLEERIKALGKSGGRESSSRGTQGLLAR